ncbi:unnamed protein product [Penicillium salamii]|uniref:Zn(2)-C6 fungal-type domain-containing protein n=1 Tax=Penicillium salamii TaxID=1612424 RepID=A0A9W4N5C9_9EURO|nr:unnamed protein product [Penicillium salamii]
MEEVASPKRRKVRNGTSSCWECKHRKKRCKFESDSNSVCISCQRRGIPCISQASADTADDEHNEYEGVTRRIDRVEDLVRQLVHQRAAQAPGRNPQQVTNRPVPFDTSKYSALKSISHEGISRGPSLTGYLNSTLPAPHIAARILNSNKQYNAPLQILQHLQPDRGLVEVPSTRSPDLFPTVHPVAYARKLIKLALCLRELDLKKSDQLSSDLGEPAIDTSRRYFWVASSHVMSQDYLVSSLDGLETLLLQSRYHISTGELQTAWHLHRRAFRIANSIDIPTQSEVPGSQTNSVWFRLLYSDCFLSLMLGQPVAITDETVLSQSKIVHNPAQTLERVHVIIARRVIARNICIQSRHRDDFQGATQESYSETRSLDLQLKKAAKAMLTAWWKSPTFAAADLDREVMDKTAKLLIQTHQYYLLVVLHQPYILGKPGRDEWEYGLDLIDYMYSTSALVAASREVLTRYIILRNFHQSLSYRGFDEKAFAASISLLFAHIGGHSLGPTNMLEHQRPHDLILLEDAICCMEKVCSRNKDLQGCSRTQILRNLSTIEAKAADGCDYAVYLATTFNKLKVTDSVGIRSDLEVHVPYLGDIHVTRQTTSLLGKDLSVATQVANMAHGAPLPTLNQQDQYTIWNTPGVFNGDPFYYECDSNWLDEWSIQEDVNLHD